MLRNLAHVLLSPMNPDQYVDAVALLDRALCVLRAHDAAKQLETLYVWRHLRLAFDTWRLQVGQAPPELQRN